MKYFLLTAAVLLVSNAAVFPRKLSLDYASSTKGYLDAHDENYGFRILKKKHREVQINLTTQFCNETAFSHVYSSEDSFDANGRPSLKWKYDFEDTAEMQQWYGAFEGGEK